MAVGPLRPDIGDLSALEALRRGANGAIARVVGAVADLVDLADLASRGEEDADLAELAAATRLLGGLCRRIVEAGQRERKCQAGVARQKVEREAWERDRIAQRQELDAECARVQSERRSLEDEKRHMADPSVTSSEIVTLNVGGEKIVQRRRNTLCAAEGSFLAARFSGRWENDADLDKEGRHFINYPPELVMPLLDYLGMRETECPGAVEPQPPQGPPHLRQEFDAMLRFFGILPARCALCAVQTPYEEVTCSFFGFAFEICAPARPARLLALETCGKLAASATVYVCDGRLSEQLYEPLFWRRAGEGRLEARCASRIEMVPALELRPGSTHCIYIATDKPCGVAFVSAEDGSVSTENEDLQVIAGRYSNSSSHFEGFATTCWYRFNGQLEYSLLP